MIAPEGHGDSGAPGQAPPIYRVLEGADRFYVRLSDARDFVRKIPPRTVQTVVCSPPYFTLRDYGTHPAVWGTGERIELGQEDHFEHYLAHIVECFRPVWDALRDDGTVWVIIGDNYAGSGKGPTGHNGIIGGQAARQGFSARPTKPHGGVKRKEPFGIPSRVRDALRADGWTFRQEIIWHKGRKPSPILDREPLEHEYVLMFSKRANYHYNAHMRDERGHKYGSVWTIRPRGSGAHSATFPVELAARCIHLGGNAPAGPVLDPFCGESNTGIAALTYWHRYLGCDLLPSAVATSIERLRALDRDQGSVGLDPTVTSPELVQYMPVTVDAVRQSGTDESEGAP